MEQKLSQRALNCKMKRQMLLASELFDRKNHLSLVWLFLQIVFLQKSSFFTPLSSHCCGPLVCERWSWNQHFTLYYLCVCLRFKHHNSSAGIKVFPDLFDDGTFEACLYWSRPAAIDDNIPISGSLLTTAPGRDLDKYHPNIIPIRHF